MILTDRQKNILKIIIEEYSKSGKPIASKELTNLCNFKCSSATIRSEMNFLEKEDLLKKLHISAGRIPTNKGYRFYIGQLMNKENLNSNEKRKIRVKVNKIKEEKDFEQELSEILADFSSSLALVGEIKENHLYFSGLEDLLERVDKEMFSTIAHFLEEAERDFESFLGDLEEEPNIFIGKEHPLLRNTQCGLILAPYKKGRDRGVLALLDSNRMNYEHNLSLLKYINEIIN